MKKINGYTIGILLFVVTPFVVVIAGYFYIASQHVSPPTIEQLRAQYPTCEQRAEFVAANSNQEKSVASIMESMPSMEFSKEPVTSLGEWWQIYREGTEKRLKRMDEQKFSDTLTELGRGCWHD